MTRMASYCAAASLRHAEPHVDRAQQEVPLDRLLFVIGLGLFQERKRVLEAAGLHEQATGSEVGDLGLGSRMLGCLSGLRVRPGGDQGRQRRTRQRNGQTRIRDTHLAVTNRREA